MSYAKKSLGQHFLTSKGAVETIIKAAELAPGDTVLEIGPGHGVLTKALLAHARRIVAVEKDETLASELEEQFEAEVANGKLVVVAGDILELERAPLGLEDVAYKVVANIPYYITGSLLRLLLSKAPRPSKAVLLVQKEVAERIARNEKESILSISVKAYGSPRYIQTVKAGSFSPPPKVDSAIVSIDDISRERFDGIDDARFFELVRAGFGQKRKQLRGNLRSFASEEAIDAGFEAAQIPAKARAEDVSLQEWLALAKALR